MALVDEVQARIGAQRLVELTNPQLPSATTLDSTRLARAATDATAEFERRTGMTYDASAAHIDILIDGVVVKLLQRMGAPMPEGSQDRWEDGIRSYRLGRVAPRTTATQTPSADTSTGKPLMDDSRMADYVPAAGASGSIDDDE